MPPVLDNKGINSGYVDEEDGWGTSMNTNLRQLSAYVMNGFAQDVATTTGLVYGYRGGVGLTGATLVNIAPGTVIVPASSTVYIVRTIAGAVTATTNPVFPDRIHMATLVTNVTSIVSVVDARYPQDFTQDGTISAVSFSTTNVPATAGAVRLGNAELIAARNAANTGNLALIRLDSANRVVLGDSSTTNTRALGSLTAVGDADVNTLAARGGANSLLLRPGTVDHCYLEFYPRTLTPTTRGGYFGYGAAASEDIELDNDLGDILFRTNDVQLGLIGNAVTCNGAINATQFNGSGAGLTTNTVPQASVVGLPTALSNLTTALGDAFIAIAGNTAAANALDTRVDGLEVPRPFASAISDNVPISRVTFGASLGYSDQINHSGLARSYVAGAWSPLNFTDVAILGNALTSVVANLINDLKARSVI
jgi:hypothetical protein